MPTRCQHCGSELREGAVVCLQCGQMTDVSKPNAPDASPPEPYPAPAGSEQQLAAPLFSAASYSADRGLTGIGGWLILPAIGLAISPFVALFGLAVGWSLMLGSKGQIVLASKPGLEPVILFEIIMDLVFVAILIFLNVLFYTRKKSFPLLMIAFYGLQFVLLLADHIMAAPFNPHSTPTTVVRSFIVCAIWIPYFLVSRRVKLTFTR